VTQVVPVVGGEVGRCFRRLRVRGRFGVLGVIEAEILARRNERQVRLVKAHRQEKGRFFLLERSHPRDGRLGKMTVPECIIGNVRCFPGQPAGTLRLRDAISEVPHVGEPPVILLRPGDYLAAELRVVTLPVRTEQRLAPGGRVIAMKDLAERHGGVAMIPEMLWQCEDVGLHVAKANAEVDDPSRTGALSRENRDPGRHAKRHLHVGPFEEGPFLGKSIDVRRMNRLTVATEFRTQVVHGEEQNVRSRPHRPRGQQPHRGPKTHYPGGGKTLGSIAGPIRPGRSARCPPPSIPPHPPFLPAVIAPVHAITICPSPSRLTRSGSS